MTNLTINLVIFKELPYLCFFSRYLSLEFNMPSNSDDAIWTQFNRG